VTVDISKKHVKISSDSGSNTDEKIDFLIAVVLALQKDNARHRRDLHEMIREGIVAGLSDYRRKSFPF